MQKVLVTGATGFIGKAVCRRLLGESIQVRAFVRGRSSELPVGVQAYSLGSIAQEADWAEVLDGVDVVVHLAARVHVMDEKSTDPISAFRLVNVEGTKQLARIAVEKGVKRIVFVSSIKAVGEETDVPYSEESIPQPIDPYGISKLEAEEALQGIARYTGLEVVILRPPLVYGPNVKANFFYLMKLVDRGVPLPFLNIKNRRSLIYLGNLVDAIVAVLNNPKASGQVYFVSDGRDVSTPELVQNVANAFEKTAHLIPFPIVMIRLFGRIFKKESSVERLLGSLVVANRKIQSELGWKAPYSMQEGLRDTVQWYRNR